MMILYIYRIMSQRQFKPGILLLIIGLTSLASGFCCWIADVLLYPIDTVSTRLKSGSKQKLRESTYSFLMKQLKRDKWGIYRGVTLTFPHSFVSTALYVYIYEQLMQKTSHIVQKYTDQHYLKLCFPFFLSSAAQAVALFFELPFDMVRTRIQMNTPEYQYKSSWQGLRAIYKSQGFYRFYLSTKIFYVTKTLYTGFQFQSYETLNYIYGHLPYSSFFNAIASAIIACSIIHPLQVIITRYALVDTTKKKLVLNYMFQRILQTQGIRGFYKGYLTQLLTHSAFAVIWIPAFQAMRDKCGVSLSH